MSILDKYLEGKADLNAIDNLRERLLSGKILLIDDTQFNIIVLREILASDGFTHFFSASNGEEGLKAVKEHNPDIIMVDLMMPVMDGFTFCSEMKKLPEFRDVPIIVQTALTSPEQRAKAFQSGATDLVTKPINANELISRTYLHLEKQILLNDLKLYRSRVEGELKSAQDMQISTLPTVSQIKQLEQKHKMSISAHFQTSSEIGGDLWGSESLSEDALAIYILDFAGHGVTAALNTFRLHTLMMSGSAFAMNPGEYLAYLNHNLVELLPVHQYATMFYGVIDRKSGSIRYATAGTTAPVYITGEKANFLDGSGFPLGINKSANYPTKEIPFKNSDMLMLYSNALIESVDFNGDCIGDEEIIKIASKSQNSQKLLAAMLEKFNQHLHGDLNDDLTINVYQAL